MDMFELNYFSPWLKGNMDNWKQLIECSDVKAFKRNAVIFYMGEVSDYAYIVKSGRVGLNTYSEDGDELTIAILESNALFGEFSILDNKPNICTAIAIKNSEVYRISRSNLIATLSANPILYTAMIEDLCSKIRLLHSHLLNVSSKNAISRVALKFIQICDKFGAKTNSVYKLSIKFTHQELASIAGLNRVTVSNVIGMFTNRGIISKDNNFYIIRDLETLKAISKQGTV